MVNPGILHPVHFAGQPRIKAGGVRFSFRKQGRKLNDILSHSCLLLSAIRLEPVQTPFPSALTQLPLSLYEPEAQIIQLLDVAPEHVLQEGEQTLQVAPLLKLPSGHVVPVEVTELGPRHFVLSLAF